MNGMKWIAASVVAFAVAALAAPAQAALEATYGFTRITNDASTDIASQLRVEVHSVANPNQVMFKFFNNVGTASVIAEIYFDDGTLLGISTLTQSAGVSYQTDKVSPPDLPGGKSLNPPFEVTAGFYADTNGAAPHNGVRAADQWVAITFELINGKTVADTLAALDGGADLRIGIHVIGIGGNGGDSDSFVNTSPVPEPGSIAVWAGLAGMFAAVAVRRRRQRATTAGR